MSNLSNDLKADLTSLKNQPPKNAWALITGCVVAFFGFVNAILSLCLTVSFKGISPSLGLIGFFWFICAVGLCLLVFAKKNPVKLPAGNDKTFSFIFYGTYLLTWFLMWILMANIVGWVFKSAFGSSPLTFVGVLIFISLVSSIVFGYIVFKETIKDAKSVCKSQDFYGIGVIATIGTVVLYLVSGLILYFSGIQSIGWSKIIFALLSLLFSAGGLAFVIDYLKSPEIKLF